MSEIEYVRQRAPTSVNAGLQPQRQGEVLDVVDVEGNPIGLRLDKATVHTRGEWHRDVHVWVTDGHGNLLQQQRALDKNIMPGEWDISVGAHVAADESYLEAAIRETKEELGLARPPEQFLPMGKLAVEMVMQPGPQQWTHRTVGENFLLVEPGLQVDQLQLQASEVIGARLYSINQLEADLLDPKAATNHASQPVELWRLGIAGIRAATQG